MTIMMIMIAIMKIFVYKNFTVIIVIRIYNKDDNDMIVIVIIIGKHQHTPTIDIF